MLIRMTRIRPHPITLQSTAHPHLPPRNLCNPPLISHILRQHPTHNLIILRPPKINTTHPPPGRHQPSLHQFHGIAIALAAAGVVALDVDVLAAAVVAAAVAAAAAAAEAGVRVADAEAVGGQVDLVVGVGGGGGGCAHCLFCFVLFWVGVGK
jgi:hypothetical protein